MILFYLGDEEKSYERIQLNIILILANVGGLVSTIMGFVVLIIGPF